MVILLKCITPSPLDHIPFLAPVQECYARLANANNVHVNIDKSEHSGNIVTNAHETLCGDKKHTYLQMHMKHFLYTINYKYSKQQG